MTNKNIYSLAFLLLLLGSVSDGIAESTASKPVLLELFTSEGCSSCPPADSLVSKLRKENRQIILLSEHVDYWDGLGWKDPFSSSEATQYQKMYCDKLHVSSMYTPQLVIDGQMECVGSNRAAVENAIKKAPALNAPISVVLHNNSDDSIEGNVLVESPKDGTSVKVFLVEDQVQVTVKRGENSGRILTQDGIIREYGRFPTNLNERKIAFKFSSKKLIQSFNARIVAVLENRDGPVGAAQVSLIAVNHQAVGNHKTETSAGESSPIF